MCVITPSRSRCLASSMDIVTDCCRSRSCSESGPPIPGIPPGNTPGAGAGATSTRQLPPSTDLILTILVGGGGADSPLDDRGDALPAAAASASAAAPAPLPPAEERGGGGAEPLEREGPKAALARGPLRPPPPLSLPAEVPSAIHKDALPSPPLVLATGRGGGGDEVLATSEDEGGTRAVPRSPES